MMTALAHGSHAWRLGELLDGLVEPDAALSAVHDHQVGALALDSRSLPPGAIFLACQGTATHGLSFADEAQRRGAIAILAEPSATWPREAIRGLQSRLGLPILVADQLTARLSRLADRFYDQPSAHLEVFGVTGATGKTSVTHYLSQALAPEMVCGIIGTIGIGLPGELRPAPAASDALGLQRILDDLRDRGARAVALEVPAGAMDGERMAAVRFTHALFTNHTPAWADRPNDTHDTGVEQRLFAATGLGWAVLNLDDPFAETILAGLPLGVAVAGYSLRSDVPAARRCDIWLRGVTVETRSTGLRVWIDEVTGDAEELVDLEVGLIGTFNVTNLLAVLAVMCSRGVPLERAAREIAGVRGVSGRMECFGGDDAPLVVVDYARTPDALEKALVNLRRHGCRRIITVFGCRGEQDPALRPLMGEVAERLSDTLILTDDNPRFESGDAIIADILAGVADPRAVRIDRERALAVRLAIALAGIGDAVLVAGKGHENTQDLGDQQFHFSDRALVVEALREWREGRH